MVKKKLVAGLALLVLFAGVLLILPTSKLEAKESGEELQTEATASTMIQDENSENDKEVIADSETAENEETTANSLTAGLSPMGIAPLANPTFVYGQPLIRMQYQLIKPNGQVASNVKVDYEIVKYQANGVRIGTDLFGVRKLSEPVSYSTYTDSNGMFTIEKKAAAGELNKIDGSQGFLVSKLIVDNLGQYSGLSYNPPAGSGLSIQNGFFQYSLTSDGGSGTGETPHKKELELKQMSDGTVGYNYEGNYVPSYNNYNGGYYSYAAKEWIGNCYLSDVSMFTKDGSPIKLFYQKPYLTEKYVNSSGTAITPPTGATQDKQTVFNSIPASYTSSPTPPNSYVTGGKTMVYAGYRLGVDWSSASAINTAKPSFLTIAEARIQNLYIVYGEAVNLTEQYVDSDGNALKGVSGKTQQWASGTPYTFTPDATKTDSDGNEWEYVGYKVGSTGALNAGAVNYTPTANTTLSYVYRQKKAVGQLTLSPNLSVVDSDATVTWTATITNAGTSEMKNLSFGYLLSAALGDEEFSYLTGSAKINGVSVTDDFLSGTPFSETIPVGGSLTVSFDTKVKGAVDKVFSANATLNGNFDPLTGKNFVRIKDVDEPPIVVTDDIGLKNVPALLDFGKTKVETSEQQLSLNTASYTANTITKGLYIRLFDTRDNATGWRLQAKLDVFQDASGSKTLPVNTAISFSNLGVEKIENANESNEITTPVSGSDVPQLTNTSSVNVRANNTAVELLNATSVQGEGFWNLRIPFHDVKLVVPANAGEVNTGYQSQLNWTLVDSL